jgi:hypothetical protein
MLEKIPESRYVSESVLFIPCLYSTLPAMIWKIGLTMPDYLMTNVYKRIDLITIHPYKS